MKHALVVSYVTVDICRETAAWAAVHYEEVSSGAARRRPGRDPRVLHRTDAGKVRILSGAGRKPGPWRQAGISVNQPGRGPRADSQGVWCGPAGYQGDLSLDGPS